MTLLHEFCYSNIEYEKQNGEKQNTKKQNTKKIFSQRKSFLFEESKYWS